MGFDIAADVVARQLLVGVKVWKFPDDWDHEVRVDAPHHFTDTASQLAPLLFIGNLID